MKYQQIGIPPYMVGDLDKTGFSNIEQQSLEFVKYTLDPWVVRWEQTLQKAFLLPRKKREYFVKLNVDGLLRGDYQSRMPDFMGGLTRGIEKSRELVKRAVEGVAGDMMVSPKLADMQAVQAQGASLEAVRQMVSGLREMFMGIQRGENFGTICIPVYVGGTLLDEVVVDAQARRKLRSGGR